MENKTLYDELVSQMDVSTIGKNEILNGVTSIESFIADSKDKGFSQDYIDRQIAEKVKEIDNKYFNCLTGKDGAEEKYKIAEQAAIDQFKKSFPDTLENITRKQIQINAMTDQELKNLCSEYLSTNSQPFYLPVEMEIFAGMVNQRLGAKYFDLVKNKMKDNGYTQPWKQFIDQTLIDYRKFSKNRSAFEVGYIAKTSKGEKVFNVTSLKSLLKLKRIL